METGTKTDSKLERKTFIFFYQDNKIQPVSLYIAIASCGENESSG